MVPGIKQKWLCLAIRHFPSLRTIDANGVYVRLEIKRSPKSGFGGERKVRAAAGQARS